MEETPALERRVSTRSHEALLQIELLEQKYADFERLIIDIDAKWSSEQYSLEELWSAKNLLAQTLGHIDKFQFESVDAIVTADLNTGKDEAKSRRKSLNQNLSSLRESAGSLFQRLTKYLASQPIPETKEEMHAEEERPAAPEGGGASPLREDAAQRCLLRMDKLKRKGYLDETEFGIIRQFLLTDPATWINKFPDGIKDMELARELKAYL